MNIAEILKDCPKGTKLYSPICGECELEEIGSFYIYVWIPKENKEYAFYYDGKFFNNLKGECLLFPSKENRDWSTFKAISEFKKGDVVVSEYGFIGILAEENMHYAKCKCAVSTLNGFAIDNMMTIERLATEEEKQNLLKVIDENGYVWDEEKLELRKKEHEIKPFDKVLVRDSNDEEWSTALFSHMGSHGLFNASSVYWRQCIPYEGNEHLVGTTNKPE